MGDGTSERERAIEKLLRAQLFLEGLDIVGFFSTLKQKERGAGFSAVCRDFYSRASQCSDKSYKLSNGIVLHVTFEEDKVSPGWKK